MIDFASSLYLGLWHGSDSLRTWTQLTTGAPVSLISSPGAAPLARRLAELQGCERATLAASTLHLFWDLFGMFRRGHAIHVDGAAYPIGLWGVERARARGAVASRFPHHDVASLRRHLEESSRQGLRPVILTDGACACCGCLAPIADYADLARQHGGVLIIDDSQALGVFGDSRAPEAPYGYGGGGSLQASGVRGQHVTLVCSLAKAFGVPMAALSGSEAMVARFEAYSKTRAHCSPPSAADLVAAEHALRINAERGDALRSQLAQRVRFFRDRLRSAGMSATGAMFPVQALELPAEVDATEVHARLLQSGMRAALQTVDGGRDARIIFIITARHRSDEIGRAVEALANAIATARDGGPQLQTDHG